MGSEPTATTGETLNRRIPELDGLRGIAIGLVLVWHMLPVALRDASPGLLHVVNSAIRFTWSGVDLFFVLSGFLLGGILLDHRRSGRYFSTFYARRFYRIVPLYLVMVGLFMGLRMVAHAPQLAYLFDGAMPLWSYLTFTQNFAVAHAGVFGAQWLGATWSLAVEEQFYLVLPLIIYFVPRRMLWFVLGSLAVVAPATRMALFQMDPNWSMSAYVLMPARADALMLGVLAALALRTPGVRATIDARRDALYVALGALSLIVCGLGLTHETIGSSRMVLFGYSVLALLYATVLVIGVTAGEADLIGKVLRWPVLRKVGMLAYAVYLFHLPLVGICCWLIASPALATLTALAATFILADRSWKYFEGPMMKRGRAHEYELIPDEGTYRRGRRLEEVA